jgi:hypothetical protein
MKSWSIKGDGNSKQEITKFSTGRFEYTCFMRVNGELFVTTLPIEKISAERKIQEWYADSHLTVEVR